MKIILLPGLDGTGVLFKPFIDALPNYIDTLIIKYPSNEELSYSELVNFVVDQLPNEKFVLLGESFSGPIAYQVALLKPENVASVIFVATFLSSPRNFLLKLSSFLPTNFILSLPIPDFIIKSFLLGESSGLEAVSLFKQSIKQVSPRILSFRLQEIAKLSNVHQLCGINSIYIQASNDRLVPNYCVKDFKAMFKNLKIFTINGPHFILQANPVASAEIVANEISLITSHCS
jgi:pimeloyl-[acyl-carrier protein] methyl ester esterase